MNTEKIILISIILIFMPFAYVSGDGVFVWKKGVDLYEPSQKAIILYDEGVEDLVLQVKYEGTVSDFAWVIPLPAKPEVEAVKEDIFAELSEYTQKRDHWYAYSGYTPEGLRNGVQVVERKKVSVYDVAVLNADDSEALIQWLNQNGFSFPEKAKTILNDYIKKKWIFVALRIHPDEGKFWVEKALNKGTLIPLKFTFSSDEVVYPLKISSLNKGETEVLIYIFYEDALVHPEFIAQAPRGGEFYYYTKETVSKWDRRDKERFPNSFDFEHCFFRTIKKKELPLCEIVLPRMNNKKFFLSKLRNKFKTEEMQDDIVFKRIEQLSKREKHFFIKKHIERDGRGAIKTKEGYLDFSNSLLCRVVDEVADYIVERPKKPSSISSNAFEFLARNPSKRALEVMELAATHPDKKVREDLAGGLRWTPDSKLIPILKKLIGNGGGNVFIYTCDALMAIGNKESAAVLIELIELLKTKEEKSERQDACWYLWYLSRSSDPDLIEVYKYFIESKKLSSSEIYNCLKGLECIDDPSAYPIVKRVLEQDDDEKNLKLAKGLLEKWKGRDKK